MQRLLSASSWTVRTGFNMDVDFCVWLLEWDGLRVPPFDRHADGTGELRAMGMTAESWYTWFRVIAQLSQSSVDPSTLYPNGDPTLTRREGPEEVLLRRRLHELLQIYRPLSNRRRTIEPRPLSPNANRYLKPNLYQALKPYRKAIVPPFVVHLARYVARVDALLPPSAVVLGLASLPDPDAYRRAVAGAAAALIEGR